MTKKRISSFRNGNETVFIIEEDEPPKNLLRQILGWIGGVVLWLLACIPGLLIIYFGISGILQKRLVAGKFRSVSYGDDAVGFGWIFVCIGLWALGQGFHLKTGRPFLKFIFNILASIAFIAGMWFLVRRFFHHPS